jgi:acetolactate synthase-1/2/3 large subunit
MTALAPFPHLTRPSGAPAQMVVDALVDVGVTHSIGLPDTVLVNLLIALDNDDRVVALRTTAEDVGVAAMMGVWLGGGRTTAVMEASGLGISHEILARMVVDRIPVILLVGHSGLHGERHAYHAAPALAGMGTLRGLGIEHHVVAPGDDIPALVRSIGATADALRRPVALVLPLGSVTA